MIVNTSKSHTCENVRVNKNLSAQLNSFQLQTLHCAPYKIVKRLIVYTYIYIHTYSGITEKSQYGYLRRSEIFLTSCVKLTMSSEFSNTMERYITLQAASWDHKLFELSILNVDTRNVDPRPDRKTTLSLIITPGRIPYGRSRLRVRPRRETAGR